MKPLFSFTLILLLSFSCQKNEDGEKEAFQYFSKYTAESIDEMVINIYVRRSESYMHKSIELAKKVIVILKDKQDASGAISLIKKTYTSGVLDRHLKYTSEEKEQFLQKIIDAENEINKFKKIKAVHLIMKDILYMGGLYVHSPNIVLTQPDTLKLKPNRKYEFPIEIIYERSWATSELEDDEQKIEIVVGEYVDTILKKQIEVKLRNRISGEVYPLYETIYIETIK